MTVTYADAPEVEAIANTLIPLHHRHLASVPVRYIYRSEAASRNGKIVYGTAQKIGGRTAFLVGLDAHVGVETDVGEPFFLVEIARDEWDEMSEDKRRALVDHELCHCVVETDKDGLPALKLRGHDLEEFCDIVERHGLWRRDIEDFAKVAAQQLEFGWVAFDGGEPVPTRPASAPEPEPDPDPLAGLHDGYGTWNNLDADSMNVLFDRQAAGEGTIVMRSPTHVEFLNPAAALPLPADDVGPPPPPPPVEPERDPEREVEPDVDVDGDEDAWDTRDDDHADEPDGETGDDEEEPPMPERDARRDAPPRGNGPRGEEPTGRRVGHINDPNRAARERRARALSDAERRGVKALEKFKSDELP